MLIPSVFVKTLIFNKDTKAISQRVELFPVLAKPLTVSVTQELTNLMLVLINKKNPNFSLNVKRVMNFACEMLFLFKLSERS